jgi:hypothetical protein
MIRTATMAGLVVATSVVSAGAAFAGDSADTADTIASPWSGGALRLAEGDKRFVLALSTLQDGTQVRGEVSAPLDDTTRTAAFVTKDGIAPAFRGAFHIGRESTYGDLALAESDAGLLPFCESNHIPTNDCSNQSDKVKDARKQEGQPVHGDGRYWSYGLDVSFAYDRKTAYRDDVGAATAEFTSTDLQIGGSVALNTSGSWAFTARIGYERANTVDLGDFRRCQALPSTDASITGQVCNDAHYLRSDPGPQSSGYGRVAIAKYPHDSLLSHYVSATELRLNIENALTDSATFDAHLLVFARALKINGSGNGSIRTGLGVTVRTALASPMGASYGRGDLYDYSLFGIVGTSF